MIGLANNETPFSGDSLFSLIRKTEIKSNRFKYLIRMPLVYREYLTTNYNPNIHLISS